MMKHEGTTFLCGYLASAELLFFSKELDELVEQDTENSSFFVMYGSDWFKYQFDGAWPAISMAGVVPRGGARTVVAVSPRGAFWEVEPKSLREINGEIDEAEYSLRALAVVDDTIYACGMGRSVLRRNGPGDWDEIGPGTTEEDDGLVIGFEDLAGHLADEIYTVGWAGEIWQFAGSTWRRLDTPVSANLNALCCGADGEIYIVGDDGAMLRGRNDVWEVLETERSDNLMDVAFFDNTVYVSTDFEILKLADDTLIAEDAFSDADDAPHTCLHLLTADDGVVSMGTKDIFRLTDGLWERLV